MKTRSGIATAMIVAAFANYAFGFQIEKSKVAAVTKPAAKKSATAVASPPPPVPSPSKSSPAAAPTLAGADAPVPPDFTLPEEIKGNPGSFIPVRPQTKGKYIVFVPLDNGLEVFPSDMLAKKTQTVVTARNPGRYRLLAYSAVGNVPTLPAFTTIVVGNAPVPPPDPVDPPPPPVVEPTDPLWPFVKVAFAADVPPDIPLRKDAAKAYAVYYRKAAKVASDSVATEGNKLWEEINRVKTNDVSADWIVRARGIFKDEIGKLFPPPNLANVPIDETKREAVATLYNRFAAMFEYLAKAD